MNDLKEKGFHIRVHGSSQDKEGAQGKHGTYERKDRTVSIHSHRTETKVGSLEGPAFPGSISWLELPSSYLAFLQPPSPVKLGVIAMRFSALYEPLQLCHPDWYEKALILPFMSNSSRCIINWRHPQKRTLQYGPRAKPTNIPSARGSFRGQKNSIDDSQCQLQPFLSPGHHSLCNSFSYRYLRINHRILMVKSG